MLLSNIFPYTVSTYQKVYDDEFVASFTHAALAKGPIDLVQSLKWVEKLNAEACLVMPCISFNQAMIKENQLEGGACSAIAFRVAKKALTILRNLKENEPLRPSSREIGFALRFSRFIHSFEEMATSRQSLDRDRQREIRTEQAAFNTITVDRETICSGNAIAEKVGAMAPFFGLKVVESSPELRINEKGQLEAHLLDQLRSLKEGVYLLRAIQETKNHKLEKQGHSSVFIKTGDTDYFFDSALGLYALFSEAKKVNLLLNALLSSNQHFGVDCLSFHRLEEKGLDRL